MDTSLCGSYGPASRNRKSMRGGFEIAAVELALEERMSDACRLFKNWL